MSGKKINPQFPRFSLRDAVESGFKIYDATKCHTVALDSMAASIGYKNSKNGAAQTKLGTLKMFGITQFEGKGKVSLSDAIEELKFSPDNNSKYKILLTFLNSPKQFSEVLTQFDNELPDDAVLKFELIRKGFNETGADLFMETLKSSIEYVESFNTESNQTQNIGNSNDDKNPPPQPKGGNREGNPEGMNVDDVEYDLPIPLRLTKGKRAFLKLPKDFNSQDRKAIRQQIDGIYIDDEKND